MGAEVDVELREQVRKLCSRYPSEYWQKLDRARSYPEEFVQELTEAGYLACLIPEQYGGPGLEIREAAVILEEIHHSGGNAAACHAQMYMMGTLLRHGSPEQKARWLPDIASGALRLQAFAVTEPDAGSDTTRISTFAERKGDRYIVNGRKIFISRVQHSDLMVLLARTTARNEVEKKTQGLSVFIVDLREAGDAIEVRPVDMMINHETNEVFFDDLEVPVENRIGEEGKGFSYILSGMNAERILLASESVGDALCFIDRCTKYAGERVVFDRPIGQNQGIQHPLAESWAELDAAWLLCLHAAELCDRGRPCGAQANAALLQEPTAGDTGRFRAPIQMILAVHGLFRMMHEGL